MKNINYGQVKNARRYKVLPHKYLSEYEYSIWIDGNYEIIGSIQEYIKKYSKQSAILCVVHPDRCCVYEEAQACIEIKKDSEDIICMQIDKYRSELYPENNGMIASGILFRKHNNPEVIKIMEDWWKEIEKYSKRDQLSFNYVCWENEFIYDKSDISCWGNEYLNRVNHRAN